MSLIRLHNGRPYGFRIETKPKFRPVAYAKFYNQLKVIVNTDFPTYALFWTCWPLS